MVPAPLPDTPAVVGPAEVVFVLRAAQPPALTCRLRSAAAIRGRTIMLTPPIAGLTGAYFVAMQALERGGRLHWRARHQPTHRATAPPRKKQNPARKKAGRIQENGGRRMLRGSAGRKRPHPRTIRFSNRPFYPVFTSPPAKVEKGKKSGTVCAYTPCLLSSYAHPVVPNEIPEYIIRYLCFCRVLLRSGRNGSDRAV